MKKFWLLAFLIAGTPAGYGQNAASLKNPATLKERAPNVYKVKFDTSAGVFEIEVNADWSPNGADRFYNLVKNGYYDGCRFFRVVPGFTERVIFRELFPRGLTLLDLTRIDSGIELGMSHVAARQEIRDLVTALKLPGTRKVKRS